MTATKYTILALGLLFLMPAAGMAQMADSCGCDASCQTCGDQCGNAFPGLCPQDFSHNTDCRYADNSGCLEPDPVFHRFAPLFQDLYERCAGCTWRFDASALYLHRAAPSSRTLLTDSTNGGILLDGGTLEFSPRVGPRFAFVVTDCEGVGLELNYFAVDGWSATRNFASADLPAGVANMAIDSIITEPVTDAQAAISSVLRSSEINVRQCLGDGVDVLCGFRWIDMYDHYFASGTSAVTGNTVQHSIVTWNHLFASQIGLDSRFGPSDGRWSIGGFVKTGVALNNADSTTSLSDPRNLGFLSSGDSECHAAVFGEAGLNACVQIDKHVSVIFGYEAMYINYVAQPLNQIAQTDLTAGTTLLNFGSGILYYGGNLGVELSW